MRFLCASNLHLGRRISGVPEHLNLDPARISTSAIWNQLVETAISEEVDAVLIAGNLIDRENRQFEPLGPLERGLAMLQRHDIPVIVVAGDQDFDILPAVAKEIGDAFQVFGSAFEPDGITVDETVIMGKSAERAIDHDHPLSYFPETPGSSLIVLLPSTLTDGHAANAFQPLPADNLDGVNAAVCILGHSREPDLVELGGQVVLEPGAICPLDPSETGPHGVWIVDTDHAGRSQLLAISPVQFESVDIDVSNAESADAVEHLVIGALHETLTRCVENDPRGQLNCVSCVVTLTGTTDKSEAKRS